MAWVLDLDGVVWRGAEPIPGAARAVAEVRAAGERVWFVTNNALPRRSEVEAKLAAHGIEPDGDVITSPMAAAALVEPGERVLVCAGAGVIEAVEARGATAVDASSALDDADVVIVGLHLNFDYGRLANASAAVRNGARFVATNDDTTYPGASGLQPGNGSLVAAVATASGVAPVVAGKPYAPMVDLVRSLAGPTGLAVGDRADTDGRFARALGYRFGLVLTGVTTSADLPVEPEPDLVAVDLTAMVTL